MMANKKRAKRFSRNLILIILTISLCSCSVVGHWWYDRLDIYITNYFFEYTEFNEEQKAFIRETSKKFHEWNSTVEIPKYKSLLNEIKTLDKQTTNDDIQGIFKKGKILFKESNDFFIPYIASFCRHLTDQQVNDIDKKFKERIDERGAYLEDSKKESRSENVVSSFNSLARFLGVKLEKRQREEIRKLSKNIVDKRSESIEIQRVWNEEFISILRSRKEEKFYFDIKEHLNSLIKIEEINKKEENIYNDMIVTTINSLNEKQKYKFQKRIGFFITSLDKVTKSPD